MEVFILDNKKYTVTFYFNNNDVEFKGVSERGLNDITDWYEGKTNEPVLSLSSPGDFGKYRKTLLRRENLYFIRVEEE